MTQAQLAKAAGVVQATIGNLEAGLRKSAREVVAIAKALGVSPAWLANGEGDMHEPAHHLRDDVRDLAVELEYLTPEQLAHLRVLLKSLLPPR